MWRRGVGHGRTSFRRSSAHPCHPSWLLAAGDDDGGGGGGRGGEKRWQSLAGEWIGLACFDVALVDICSRVPLGKISSSESGEIGKKVRGRLDATLQSVVQLIAACPKTFESTSSR